MSITPEQVRKGLQTLKKKLNTANVLQEAITRHQARIAYLNGTDAQLTRNTINSLTRQMQTALIEMANLESQYMTAILGLNTLYKTIIIDYYINGKQMWQVGNTLHYDRATLYRLADKAITEIAKAMGAQ